ncbi:AAA family ATPase [Celerinatantimonas sp. YJH-8]|uniref:AAA family ATPase n=1 Tax=Celerinatantimonas sp. YJH-8 TaxID=3228714 RepID=UPI0038C09FB3
MSTGIDFKQLKPDFSSWLPYQNDTAPYAQLQAQFVDAFQFFCSQSDKHLMLVQAPVFCEPEPLLKATYPSQAKSQTILYEQQHGYFELATQASSASGRKWIFDESLFTQYVIAEHFAPEALFGSIPSRLEQGTLITDIEQYHPGQIALANHGIWVVYARDILEQPQLWQQLLTCVQTGQLQPQDLTSKSSYGVAFDAIPLYLKVVIWGESNELEQLLELSPRLWYQAAIKCELNEEVKANQANVNAWLSELNQYSPQILTSDIELQQLLLQLASRRSEHNQYLALDFSPIVQLIAHAALQHSEITAQSLKQVLTQHVHYRNGEWKWSQRSYIDRQIKIDLHGQQIGQINGLSVLETPGISCSFGEPMRITATVHLGEGDLSDVERKAELAGNIHAKSMMIIQGYLSQQFARDGHFPLAGTLVFEQSYHEIDGDSASLASLIAILSSLSGLPIDQSFATTGAIDQLGNVLAVGGINEKIEGFFQVCQLIDPQNRHSIIIPAANLLQLNLSDDVVTAVEMQIFTIHAIERVEQALELLFNQPAGSTKAGAGILGQIDKRAQFFYQNENDDERSSLLACLFKWLKKRG